MRMSSMVLTWIAGKSFHGQTSAVLSYRLEVLDSKEKSRRGGVSRNRIPSFASTTEETAVNKIPLRGIGLAATAALIAVVSYGASAQEKKAPAKKPSTCNLKDEGACRARNDCNWVEESKDAKGKVKRKAYCRANPTPKKDDAKKK
jgi:hypothetical protein